MRTLTQKYLGGYPLDEGEFQVDLQVVEKYVSFSTELLRLSLLGIAGYGFLIANVVLNVKTEGGGLAFLSVFSQPETVTVLWLGLAALGSTAMTALAHRYFAADCITHFVRRVRLSNKRKELPENDPKSSELSQIIEHEQQSLDRDVEFCRWLLIASCFCLVIGAFCVAVAFAITLYGANV